MHEEFQLLLKMTAMIMFCYYLVKFEVRNNIKAGFMAIIWASIVGWW